MAVKGYFYNAIKTDDTYDRLYNDEDFCSYLNKVISNGIFPSPSTNFNVSTNNNMTVSVAPGDAWLEGHKVTSDAIETLIFDAADPIFNRIDRVVLYTDSDTQRAAGLRILKGTAASNPVPPELTRTDDIFELCLANVTIAKGATAITAADIFDTRPDSEVCGWVAGLIQQVDVSTLYAQWSSMYRDLYSRMENWQEEMKGQFDDWFYTLTSTLSVGAYIRQFHKVVEGGDTVSNVIPLDMADYVYDENDIFIANLNGLALTRNVDYIFSMNLGVPTITLDGDMTEGNVFEITVLKSSLAQTENAVVRRVSGDRFLYCDECMPGQAKRFLISNLGDSNEIVISNRNLVDGDQIEDSETINGVTFTKNSDGTISLDGTMTEAIDTFIEIEVDRNALQYADRNVHLILVDISDLNEGEGVGQIALDVTYNDSSSVSHTETVVLDSNSATNEKYEPPMIQGYTESQYDIQTAVIRIGVPSDSETTTFSNVTLKPMVIYSLADSYSFSEMMLIDYAIGSKSTVTYDEDIPPVLSDFTNYIWSTDNNVSGMNILYVETAQPLPRNLELMYHWDYSTLEGDEQSGPQVWGDLIHNKRSDINNGGSARIYGDNYPINYRSGMADPTPTEYCVVYYKVMDVGRIVEIQYGYTELYAIANRTAGFFYIAYPNYQNYGLFWSHTNSCWCWGRSDYASNPIIFRNLTDPNIFRNGKLKIHWISKNYMNLYINDVFIATVPKVYSNNENNDYCIAFGSFDYMSAGGFVVKDVKIWG